ncbi:carbamoyltransferase family protein [Synechococcus sp. MVIR-18-1]|nr:carbamoyltransferase family protein [Synechococcus sp. MVIR-18-1]
MNRKIKYRESFRPFAPSVLEEDVSNQFEMNSNSPYMLLVAPVKKELCKQMPRKKINFLASKNSISRGHHFLQSHTLITQQGYKQSAEEQTLATTI